MCSSGNQNDIPHRGHEPNALTPPLPGATTARTAAPFLSIWLFAGDRKPVDPFVTPR